MRLIISFVCLIILAGCAVMDLNTMDTAIPIHPDIMSINSYAGVGLDYSSPFFKGEQYIEEHGQDNDLIGADVFSALKMGVAINEELDAQAKVFRANTNWGAKLGVKKLMYQKGRTYYALMPMLTHVYAKFERRDSDHNTYYDVYQANGAEMSGLLTYKFAEFLMGTLSARYNLSYYHEESAGQNIDPFLINHGGISAGLRLHLKVFFLGVEYGFEMIPNNQSKVKGLPFAGVGGGIQI